MFRITTIASVAAASLAVAIPAFAQSGLQVGVLHCAGGPNASYVVGSTAALNCVFRSGAGAQESYAGTLQRVGLDIGFTNGSGVGWWAVYATSDIGKGGLAGSYGGISANAAVGLGGGANVLLGGSNQSVTLQPLSLQGQTGLNAAATVTSLQLQPVVTGRKASKKR